MQEMQSSPLPSMAELSGLNPAFRNDPHPPLDRLRTEAPRHCTSSALFLTTQMDSRQALADARLSRDPFKTPDGSIARMVVPQDILSGARPAPMLWLDDPEHQANRGLIQPAFFRRCAGMRARVEAIVDDLLVAAEKKEAFDGIADFAVPLPVYVISDILGLPREDMGKFRRLSSDLVLLTNKPFRDAEENALLKASNAELDAYFRRVIAARRLEPRDDLISDLIAAELDGKRLNDGDLVSTIFLLLLAGNLTTTDLIGNGIVLLLDHPQELKKLRTDPRLARGVVEEVLRFAPPVIMTVRNVVSDLEVLGCPMHPGNAVIASIQACNRDPAVFDDPHTFRIDRGKNEHLAFGGGVHHCLGAPLARLEAEIAFLRLFTRFHRVNLVGERPHLKPAHAFSGYEAIPLAV
jgi:cytochrome P450